LSETAVEPERREKPEKPVSLTASRIAKAVRSEIRELIYELYPPSEPAYEPFDQLIFGTTTAGQDYRYRIPTRFYPQSVHCRVTCDATVGDRNVAVEYRDGNDVRFVVAGSPVTIAASQQQTFVWHAVAATPQWPVTNAALAPLPQFWLTSPWLVAITVYGGSGGDLIDQIRLAARY
jgi:hypothetical protein